MLEAVANRLLRVRCTDRPVHRLQEEVAEVEVFEVRRFGAFLRKDELELLTSALHDVRPRLWAHANPINARGTRQRSVGLDGNLEPSLVKRVYEAGIKLKKRLATGAHD